MLACFEGGYHPYHGHSHGHITFLDQHYETVWKLRAVRHKISDKHEFHAIDGETGLIQPEPRDLSLHGAGPDQQCIVNAIFQAKCMCLGYGVSPR